MTKSYSIAGGVAAGVSIAVSEAAVSTAASEAAVSIAESEAGTSCFAGSLEASAVFPADGLSASPPADEPLQPDRFSTNAKAQITATKLHIMRPAGLFFKNVLSFIMFCPFLFYKFILCAIISDVNDTQFSEIFLKSKLGLANPPAAA
jgi:hypothetical protein